VTISVQQVANDVRESTDQSNSQEVSDATLLLWIQQSAQDLYDKIVTTDKYLITYMSASVTQTSYVNPNDDVGIVAPADFYRMVTLDRITGAQQQRYAVPCIHQSQRNANWMGLPGYGNLGFGTNGDLSIVGYFIETLNTNPQQPVIVLVPPACATANYELRYNPQMPVLTSLTSNLLPIMADTGWYVYIVNDVAMKINERLRMDGSAFKARRDDIAARIAHAAVNRDVTYGHRLDPNRGRQRWGWPYGGR
jgi:hypothetical protein